MAQNKWTDDQHARWDDDRSRSSSYGQRGSYREEYEGNRGSQRFDRDDDDAGYGGRYDDGGYPSRYAGYDERRGYRSRGWARPSDYQDEDRDWFDRASDEVSSWMGDEDARRRRRLDKIEGEHRGKGPKGYTRSDDRIQEDVSDRLSDDSYLDASEIEVAVSKCEVTLSGTVDSRADKRRAEDLAENVSGVRHVQNNLRVSGSSPSETRTQGARNRSTQS